jgi:flavin-binding protein dodecin
MAKQAGSAESIYKIVEVIGTSTKSWDDAAKNAVETASGTLRDLRVAEIVKLDMKVEDGKVRAYRARVALSFKYESWNSDQAWTSAASLRAGFSPRDWARTGGEWDQSDRLLGTLVVKKQWREACM